MVLAWLALAFLRSLEEAALTLPVTWDVAVDGGPVDLAAQFLLLEQVHDQACLDVFDGTAPRYLGEMVGAAQDGIGADEDCNGRPGRLYSAWITLRLMTLDVESGVAIAPTTFGHLPDGFRS